MIKGIDLHLGFVSVVVIGHSGRARGAPLRRHLTDPGQICRIFFSLNKHGLWAKQYCLYLLEYLFAWEEIIDKIQRGCLLQIWKYRKLYG